MKNNPLLYMDPMGLTADYVDNNSSDYFQIPTFDKYQYTDNISLNIAKMLPNVATDIVNSGIGVANLSLNNIQYIQEKGVSAYVDYSFETIETITSNIVDSTKNFGSNIIDYYSSGATPGQFASDLVDFSVETVKQLKYAETWESNLTVGLEVAFAGGTKSLADNVLKNSIRNNVDVVAPKSGIQATKVTEKGIARIEKHFKTAPGIKYDPKNTAMIERLKAGKVTDWDLKFYQHELRESRIIKKIPSSFKDKPGGILHEAHKRTSYRYDMEFYDTLEELIHPDVIKKFEPDYFD